MRRGKRRRDKCGTLGVAARTPRSSRSPRSPLNRVDKRWLVEEALGMGFHRTLALGSNHQPPRVKDIRAGGPVHPLPHRVRCIAAVGWHPGWTDFHFADSSFGPRLIERWIHKFRHGGWVGSVGACWRDPQLHKQNCFPAILVRVERKLLRNKRATTSIGTTQIQCSFRVA